MHIGREAAITWDRGQLSSTDAVAEEVARSYAASMGPIGIDVTPTGPRCRGRLLSTALCALTTLQDLFEEYEVEGEVPTPPSVPSGAVA